MSDKHPAPWHVVYNFEEKKCSVSDSGENKLSSREIVESHNSLSDENARLREVLGNLVETSNRMCVTSRLGTKEWDAAMNEAESLLKGSLR